MRPTLFTDAAEKARREYLEATAETDRIALPEPVEDGWEVARRLERLLGEARDALVKARERIKYNDPKILSMQEIDDTLARIDATLDPNNLEGPPRTQEEMAAERRELNRIAPTPAEKLALMFGKLKETSDELSRRYHENEKDRYREEYFRLAMEKKSTVKDDDLDEPLPPKQCGIDDPDCESCQ